jgi:hypothetical protein
LSQREFHGDEAERLTPEAGPVNTSTNEQSGLPVDSVPGNDDEAIEEFDLDSIELIESKVFG